MLGSLGNFLGMILAVSKPSSRAPSQVAHSEDFFSERVKSRARLDPCITVLKKNLHKLRFANRNPSGLDPFLDTLFGAKNRFFPLFFEKNTKKYLNILMREMINMIGNWSFAPPALQGVI